MLLLALDTSTTAVTVAVHDGSGVLAEASQLDARRHAELLAPQVVDVLRTAGAQVGDLTAIAVGVGPGPFTGLRVGVATALVLGWTAGVPVHGVCSLDAIAHGVATSGEPAPSELIVATDARRREVYWAPYRLVGARYVRVAGPAVAAADAVPRDWTPVAGRGPLLYPEALGAGLEPLDVRAADLAAVAAAALAGTGQAPAGEPVLLPVEPLYLRRPDAMEPGARKRVLQ